jgi:hypothetical protein
VDADAAVNAWSQVTAFAELAQLLPFQACPSAQRFQVSPVSLSVTLPSLLSVNMPVGVDSGMPVLGLFAVQTAKAETGNTIASNVIKQILNGCIKDTRVLLIMVWIPTVNVHCMSRMSQ